MVCICYPCFNHFDGDFDGFYVEYPEPVNGIRWTNVWRYDCDSHGIDTAGVPVPFIGY